MARIRNDCTLIWCAIDGPIEKEHKYYAHAVILRNGYIYYSNLRMSEKYEDFIKLYKVRLYRQWNSNDYSKKITFIAHFNPSIAAVIIPPA